MESNELSTPVQSGPPVVNINGTEYVTAPNAADYLGVHYSTVLNLVNARQRYLVAEKIGATLFVTAESLEAEKIRRAGLRREADELAARINAQPEKEVAR